MTWSLGEVEALSRKAARGSGLNWGLAEEAGKATRWLEARGLPGIQALAGYLQEFEGTGWADVKPLDATLPDWVAPAGRMSPLAAGSALCDLGISEDLRLNNLCWPLLCVPYMAWASDRGSIAWPGVIFMWEDDTLYRSRTEEGTLLAPCVEQTLLGETIEPGAPCMLRHRTTVPDAAHVILTGFAARTYAPETDASRLSGAGAGLVDRD